VPFLGIYAACKEEPKLDPHRNYYTFTTEDITKTEVLREPDQLRPDLMLASYVVRNNRNRQPGKKGLHPLTLHAPANYRWFERWRDTRFADRPEDYHAFKQELGATILSSTDQFVGFDRSIIEHFEVSTPLSNEHYNGSIDGSAYGIYHSVAQTGMRGLGPRTHIKNLLLTGQSTLFPGLLGSAIAGLRSAGHIVGIKPILRELKHCKIDRGDYS
jgi:all-trans-retinol 13,14-reductase